MLGLFCFHQVEALPISTKCGTIFHQTTSATCWVWPRKREAEECHIVDSSILLAGFWRNSGLKRYQWAVLSQGFWVFSTTTPATNQWGSESKHQFFRMLGLFCFHQVEALPISTKCGTIFHQTTSATCWVWPRKREAEECHIVDSYICRYYIYTHIFCTLSLSWWSCLWL